MRLDEFFNRPLVTGAGIRLAHILPRRLGYGLARLIAAAIAARRPRIYRVVRGNLGHVLGPGATAAELDALCQAVFAESGRANIDFFRAIGRDVAALGGQITFPPELFADIRARLAAGRGVLFLGAHMSGFNLGILRLSAYGIPMQLLSLANPNQGFALLNRFRSGPNVELTPITTQTLRQAIRRLKAGGLVITALDRPVPGDHDAVTFLGAPSYLPTGPARLAVLTGADVIAGYCHRRQDGSYALESETLEIPRSGDRRQDVKDTSRQLAAMLEVWVRRRPEQWLMFEPIWPEHMARSAPDARLIVTERAD